MRDYNIIYSTPTSAQQVLEIKDLIKKYKQVLGIKVTIKDNGWVYTTIPNSIIEEKRYPTIYNNSYIFEDNDMLVSVGDVCTIQGLINKNKGVLLIVSETKSGKLQVIHKKGVEQIF